MAYTLKLVELYLDLQKGLLTHERTTYPNLQEGQLLSLPLPPAGPYGQGDMVPQKARFLGWALEWPTSQASPLAAHWSCIEELSDGTHGVERIHVQT